MLDTYRNKPLEFAIRAEICEKGCGCCTKSVEVLRGAFLCPAGKKFPACKREENGFEYDEGEA